MRLLLLALAILFVGGQGCATTAPIVNVSNMSLNAPSGTSVTLEDVSQAIRAAGKRLGWEMSEIRPGELSGTLALRKHLAVVTITHDTSTFSITYRSSVNLRYRGNTIHRNYNNWISNLAKGIQAEMTQVARR